MSKATLPSASRMPSNFLSFPNGDVIISIPPNDVYRLHSDVLRRSSPTHLGVLLAPEHGAQLAKAAVSGGCFTRYKLELIPSKEHPNGIFHRKEVDRFGRTVADSNLNCHTILTNLYDARIPVHALESWRSLFGAFYNKEPDMSGTCLGTVLEKSVHLMDTADSIGAAAAVRAYVDNSLMRQGQMLYRAVLANPICWGNLALRVESPSIFNDAVIHLVGKWNSFKKTEKQSMHPHIRAVCEQKAAELYKIKGAIEMRISGHIPQVCTRRASQDPISRVSYSTDIYMWMAVSIHRHWCFQVTGIERRGRDGLDGGAAFYRAIHEGGASYLNPQDYINFHNVCPMSQKARTMVYDKIRQIKYEIRHYVHYLMLNRSQLDINDIIDLDHLLCTEMSPSDHPWNITDVSRLKHSEMSDVSDGGEGQPQGGLPPDTTKIPVFGSDIHRPEFHTAFPKPLSSL